MRTEELPWKGKIPSFSCTADSCKTRCYVQRAGLQPRKCSEMRNNTLVVDAPNERASKNLTCPWYMTGLVGMPTKAYKGIPKLESMTSVFQQGGTTQSAARSGSSCAMPSRSLRILRPCPVQTKARHPWCQCDATVSRILAMLLQVRMNHRIILLKPVALIKHQFVNIGLTMSNATSHTTTMFDFSVQSKSP